METVGAFVVGGDMDALVGDAPQEEEQKVSQSQPVRMAVAVCV